MTEQPITEALTPSLSQHTSLWKAPIFWVSLVFVVLGVLFYLKPEWDLAVSSWFFKEGQGFYLKDNILVLTVYWFFRYVHFLFLALLIGGIAYSFVKPQSSVKPHRKRLVYALVVLLLGPGLIVHTLFKDQWDRARPRDVIEFQGDKIHSPAFVISDQCERNCSFVSGHAAIAFYFMIFGFIGRRRWLWPGLAMGVLGAFGRVVQGGHFFSDVMFAGFFVYFTCWFLAKWMKITPAFDSETKPIS